MKTEHTSAKKPGWFRRLASEQANQVWGPAHRAFWSETMSGVKRAFATRVNENRRVETFEGAVQRLGLTDEFLDDQLCKYKAAHLMLYGLSGLMLVFGTYMGTHYSVISGLAAYIAAGGGFVSGYLHGFRAWQIENRNLIRLEDAVRIRGTYLVL